MNPLRALSETYIRWRHSRGYGVHSPFAYNLVKTAVRPPRGYGYYGYYDIDRALLYPDAGEYPRLRSDAMLLLRMLATLRSHRLLLYPPVMPVFEAAADSCGVKCIPLKEGKIPALKNGDFLLVKGKFPHPRAIEDVLSQGVPVMAIDPSQSLMKTLKGFSGKGVLLEGTRIIAAIPNQDMAFVRYTMKF